MLFILLVILISVFLCIKFFKHSHKQKLICKIPGPKSLPFIGNSRHFQLPLDKLFIYLRKLYKIHGGIYQIHAPNVRAVNIFDPADVEVIMSSTRFTEKYLPYTFMKPWLGDGLLVSNGNKWYQRRKMLTRTFHFNILKKYSRTMIEQAEELLMKIQAEVGNNQTDVLPFITKTTLNVMCETAMGTSMKEDQQIISDKYFQAIHTIGQSVVQRLVRVWLYIDATFACSKIGKIQKKAIKDLHEFTMKIIQERKAYLTNNNVITNADGDDEVYGKTGRLAMLDLLLENEKQGMIDVEGIREEVDTFMFEGHDTTAMALSFMIMRIANEPDIQISIYEEMLSIFGESQRRPTLEDLAKMKYLECCIKESLRLYPSVPFISRYIAEEVELSGYTIPSGTLCQIHVFDIHRNEHLYPNPNKFIPERFISENHTLRHPYAYLPFSAGPRNCIGQKFAMMEMKIMMSSLLRRFRVEPVTKPDDITFTCDLVLRATHPLFVRFLQRK
ncbi:unnamed protein product [Parnassius apollo]|uniref:(apollo) hypothetical protein n=1 Tax=Parnassius apollo TaxID=110799 RepID=A0A8S3WNM8_PARAO|nr:unnamed protein product [Parnassius apollo]